MLTLLIGASGLLGTHLELNNPTLRPSHSDLDIESLDDIYSYLHDKQDIQNIVLAAAWTNVASSNYCKPKVYDINVNGPRRLLEAIRRLPGFNPIVTYISTDYVFRGDVGDYKVDSPIDPVPNNYYALSKAMGEIVISTYKKHCIIRTSFCRSDYWPYPRAFEDQYTSRDTVDIIAPKIARLIESQQLGVFHIGTERKSVYELALRIDPTIQPSSRSSINTVYIPYDTSLELSGECYE